MGRSDAWAILGWIALAAVAVLIRGIRWDEHYELAEVVLGRVPYPEEHPLYFWTRYVRNFPIFLSSAVVALFPGPEVICALRNLLWVSATVIPAYLIGRILGGSARCGHVGAVLILAGLQQNFDANYPLYTWPSYFSNGHIGRGFALTTFCLLLAGNRRTALFMLGLLPSVHMGQAPLIYMFAGLVAISEIRAGRMRPIVRAIPWTLPGLALWAGLWLYGGLTVPVATAGPYFSPVDAQAIADAYIGQHSHWAPPGTLVSFVNSNFILGAVLLLLTGRAYSEYRVRGNAGPWTLVALYFAIVAGIVWSTMILHTAFGSRLPYALLAWMPYRFTNHAASLFTGIAAAILLPRLRSKSENRAGWLLVCAVLSLEFAKPLFTVVLNRDLYDRYLFQGDAAAFVLLGGAAATIALTLREGRRAAALWLSAAIGGIAAFSFHHQFGAACLILGAAIVLAAGAADRRQAVLARVHARFEIAVPFLASLLLLSVSFNEWRNRTVLPRSDFEIAVTDYLRERGNGQALIVARPDQVGLHARLHHPILADGATGSAIVYTPQVAPTIQKLHEDLYGIRFHPRQDADAPSWDTVWAERSTERWQELGRLYSFRHIIAPNPIPVAIHPVIVGTAETLYEIPVSGPSE